jgi:hypothetical protein
MAGIGANAGVQSGLAEPLNGVEVDRSSRLPEMAEKRRERTLADRRPAIIRLTLQADVETA